MAFNASDLGSSFMFKCCACGNRTAMALSSPTPRHISTFKCCMCGKENAVFDPQMRLRPALRSTVNRPSANAMQEASYLARLDRELEERYREDVRNYIEAEDSDPDSDGDLSTFADDVEQEYHFEEDNEDDDNVQDETDEYNDKLRIKFELFEQRTRELLEANHDIMQREAEFIKDIDKQTSELLKSSASPESSTEA